MAIALNANAKKDSDRQLRDAVLQLKIAGLKLKDFDPYQKPLDTNPPRKKSPVTVTLNGGLYVTEKTRTAFQKALQDGQKIMINNNNGSHNHQAENDSSTSALRPETAPYQVVTPQSETKPQNHQVSGPANGDPALAKAFEKSLADFESHQSETTRLHEQYLNNDAEYSRIFANLSQMEISLLSNKDSAQLASVLPALESLEKSMMRFHDHQAETLRIHEDYLKSQAEFSQNFVRLVQQQFGVQTNSNFGVAAAPTKATRQPETPVPAVLPVKPVGPEKQTYSPAASTVTNQPAVPVQVATVKQLSTPIAAPQVSSADISRDLLNVVSEKTGYPVEMLELEMDMEADLGIDSIKRVEILGAMQALYPSLPKIDPETLAELRTLGQIITKLSDDYHSESVSTPAAPDVIRAIEAPALPVSAEMEVAAQPDEIDSVDGEQVTQAFLQTVSEKTGYPVEMLELDMDMEADLGIDSIKRVEILGAIQTQFQNLPKIEPETLAELRTLRQVTDHLAAGLEQPRPF